MVQRLILGAALSLVCAYANANACYRTMLTAPSPFLGNHGEIFRTAEGNIYEVIGSYEYLYAYHPTVTICPSAQKLLVDGRTIGINPIKTGQVEGKRPKRGSTTSNTPQAPQSSQIQVVLRVRGCDYFIADGPQGYYVLQHYGGHDPIRGEGIHGDLGGFGFKDILYQNGQEGRVYVDNYLLGKERALERLQEKCS